MGHAPRIAGVLLCLFLVCFQIPSSEATFAIFLDSAQRVICEGDIWKVTVNATQFMKERANTNPDAPSDGPLRVWPFIRSSGNKYVDSFWTQWGAPLTLANRTNAIKKHPFNDQDDTEDALDINDEIWTGRLLVPMASEGRIELAVCVDDSLDSLEFPVGTGPSADCFATLSNIIKINVTKFTLSSEQKERFQMLHDTQKYICMEWEPWFTPNAMNYATAEAVPLIGKYSSFNPLVPRLHTFWLTHAGVNCLLIDWSNNILGVNHWKDRPIDAQEIINATTLTAEIMTEMERGQGHFIPTLVLLLGLDNGPVSTMEALNDEIDWVTTNYFQNESLSSSLWAVVDDKPLLTVFDGGNLHSTLQPVNDTACTVRWVASQLQSSHLEKDGFWSWMDGQLHPIPTPSPSDPATYEALTVTVAFFGDGGWLYPQAQGRENGKTIIQQWWDAVAIQPTFLLFNQFNEFAGHVTGSGPNHDIYVDCYNISLSNDIEPTSLSECTLRDCGGWGMYYLNQLTALSNLYFEAVAGSSFSSTVMSVAQPKPGQSYTFYQSQSVMVEWATVGAPMGYDGVSLWCDNILITSGLQGNYTVVDLSSWDDGRHTLTVRADGAVSYYRLSSTQLDQRLDKPIPPEVSIEFTLLME